jgi:hypothetical protein
MDEQFRAPGRHVTASGLCHGSESQPAESGQLIIESGRLEITYCLVHLGTTRKLLLIHASVFTATTVR